MAVCETCWAEAQRDVMLLGGSVVDHYHRRIAESGSMPDHALPPAEVRSTNTPNERGE